MGVIWEEGDGKSIVIVGGVANKQRRPPTSPTDALAATTSPSSPIKMIAPAVLHIPHSSRLIPESQRRGIVLSDAALETELIRMTDSYTDELFDCAGDLVERLVFPVSRLIVDPERFVDDASEPMSARGMGVIYERTSHGEVLRSPVDAARRLELIAAYYQPHHDLLRDAVGRALDRWGKCLVIDCHSFPSKPLPYEPNQSSDRPQICIGTDPFHTPALLAHLAEELFADAGFTVARNHPFAGALVPTPYYRQEPRVLATMIEVNRALYMDENSGARLPWMGEVAAKIQGVVRSLIQWAVDSSGAG